ncbi:hypothetical protein Q3G72_009659 [Acer saccharum]|nr:hypothetical protein Q3G72_009659 [Acer saccharum]
MCGKISSGDLALDLVRLFCSWICSGDFKWSLFVHGFVLMNRVGVSPSSRGICQHSNPSFAKFLLRRRHYPISAANLPTDTIVASPSVRCSSTRNGVMVQAMKAARSSDPVQMGSSAAKATTGRSKAAATVAVRWWRRLWQQGRSEKFFSPSGRCP